MVVANVSEGGVTVEGESCCTCLIGCEDVDVAGADHAVTGLAAMGLEEVLEGRLIVCWAHPPLLPLLSC